MRKFLLLLTALIGFAGLAAAEPLPTEQALKERILGDPEAPITIIEYASLTCPHCANFHNNVLPKIIKEWLATGRAKIYFRDQPTAPAQVAVALAMVARCAPEEDYFYIIGTLYKTQSEWLGTRKSGEMLSQAIDHTGVPVADAQACLENKDLFDGILARSNAGRKEYGVVSTPSFVIGGKTYKGMKSYEEFDAILRELAP